MAARMQAGDAGRFFEDQPPRLRLGIDDLGDLALPHQGRRARAGRDVGEQKLHVARPHIPAVDAIGRAGFALDAPRDFERFIVVELRRRRTVVIRSVTMTSAMLRAGRCVVPEKMTSSMPEARMFL